MNRRNFLKASTLLGGGLLLSFSAASSPGIDTGAELGPFLKILPDGQILFRFVKHEMGQGISTSMAMILCEELGADWKKVKIVFPDVDMEKYQNPENGGHDTGGSVTIIYQWDMLRKAGAAARSMLINAAARRWNVSASSCSIKEGYIMQNGSDIKLEFGQLATEAAQLPVPSTPQLKDRGSFSLIGTPQNAKLTPEIVTAKIKYGIDQKVEGMLYAVISRAPVFRGKLINFNATETLKVKGVRKVIATTPIAGEKKHIIPHDIRDGVAVVGDSFWSVKKGREKLKITWNDGPFGQMSSDDFEKLAHERTIHRSDPTGFIGDPFASANVSVVKHTMRASYVYPYQLHSCMEPLNCTVHMKDNACEVWTGSQAPNLIVDEIHRVFGIDRSKITVHNHPSGGGFGRRYYPDVAVEAAFISREAGNVPVKLIWTREDDQQSNMVHHFQHLDYQVSFDKDNKLYAWYEKEARTYTWGAKYFNPTASWIPYTIPNIRYDFEDIVDDSILHSSAWRGVVGHGRAYTECFVDEIAHYLKRDPLEFRVSLIDPSKDIDVGEPYPVSSSRFLRVLKLAAEKAEWGKALPAGKGMGIAVSPYIGANSYCAVIAEVEINNGVLKIEKLTAAVDCGLVVNPLGVQKQVSGGLIWSLCALLHGGVVVKQGRAVHSNFHQNKLIRMNECPHIDVHIVDTTLDRPFGVGEISSPLGVPSVLNAIFAATGKRIRKIPLDLSLLKSDAK